MALKKLCKVLMFSSLILTLSVTISYGKAVPEESQKNYEGHLGYSHDHENEDPMFKYYDPQNYMFKPFLPIPKQNYYIPMINEEPILVPPISDSSSDINKILGNYFSKNERAPQYGDMENAQDYKSTYNFAPAWKDVPPVAYDYKTEEVDYEEPVVLNVLSKNHNTERDDVNSQNFESTPTTQLDFLKHGFKPSHQGIQDLESKNKLQYKQPQVTGSKVSSVPNEDKDMFPGTIKNEMDSVNDKKHGGKNFFVSKVKTSMKITSDEYDYDLPQIHETVNIKNAGDFSQKGKEKVKELDDYDSPVFTTDIKKISVDSKKEQLETLTNAPESETDFDLPLVVKVENIPGLRKPHKIRMPGMKNTNIAKETKIRTKSKGHNISIDKEFKGISKPKGNIHSTHIPVLKIKKNPLDKGEKLVIKCDKLKSSGDLDCLEKNDILDESSKQPNDDFKTPSKETESESKKPVHKKPGGHNPKTSSEKSKLKSEWDESESTTEKAEEITSVKSSYERFPIPKHEYFRLQATENFPELEHSYINNAQINNPKANVEIDLQSQGSGNAEEDPLSLSVDDKARGFLSSFSPNLWSLVFNPNAKNHKLKKCVTRNGESGYCTYIQNCPVPDIATSLEQLLNNACVVDEMFIGVCCPEFPVETVKVHWEQVQKNPSDKIFDGFSFEDCGTRSREVSKVHLWPWKAPLVSMSNGKIFCGGVVITDEYVLTAAHCTTKIPKNQILVRLGQHNDSSGEDFPVIEIKRHAQYNPRNLHNDIALLKLGRRITHNEYTDIVCLPKEEDDNDEHDGDKAILLGWKGIFGENSKKDRPELLEVMSLKECRKKMGMNVPDSILCTEARNEDERTCNADSGAPLIVEDDDKYEVIGILSWNRNDCDQRFPSTFSRVSSYLGWIRKHAV